jgi:hypothetical protein
MPKNHMAPGTDQIIAELLKEGGESLWRRIQKLIKLIWTPIKCPKNGLRELYNPYTRKGTN